MARNPRIEFPDGLYYIITKGNRREEVFSRQIVEPDPSALQKHTEEQTMINAILSNKPQMVVTFLQARHTLSVRILVMFIY